METRTKMLEDRPDRIVLRESFMPWRWGGPQLPAMLFIPVLWPLLRLVFDKKTVFDRADGSIVVGKRFLFVRRQARTHFSDVDSISVSPRQITEVVAGNRFAGTVTIRVKDLSLTLFDGTRLNVATAYRGSPELEALGSRLGGLMGRPLVQSEDA